MAMKCPTCGTVDLSMADRQGIEIDYCPECRGVWLDRGELDKIIERTHEEYEQVMAPMAALAQAIGTAQGTGQGQAGPAHDPSEEDLEYHEDIDGNLRDQYGRLTDENGYPVAGAPVEHMAGRRASPAPARPAICSTGAPTGRACRRLRPGTDRARLCTRACLAATRLRAGRPCAGLRAGTRRAGSRLRTRAWRAGSRLRAGPAVRPAGATATAGDRESRRRGAQCRGDDEDDEERQELGRQEDGPRRPSQGPLILPPDIGVPTDVRWDLALGACLERIAGLATFAEIYSWEHHSLLVEANRREAQACGLRLTVHGPYDGLEVGSLDETERAAAAAEHRRHLEAAAAVGAEKYVVHPDFSWTPRPRDWRVAAALGRTIAELGAAQAETGVRVVLENMPGVGCSHFVAPGDLDLGELGFLLDTGHALISGTLDAFLADHTLPLSHVHLHDNHGPSDADDPHLPLGLGVVDAGGVLAAARHAGATVILEFMSEEDLRQSIDYLVERALI